MKLDFIQALRGFAALSVVFFHSQILQKNGGLFDSQILKTIFNLGEIGVDIFFMVSGLVMTVTIKKNADLYKNNFVHLSSFITKRIWRIAILYWVFSIIALFLLCFFEPSKLLTKATLLQSFLLFPSAKPFVLMVGWSLVYEFYFYILFGFCCFFWGYIGIIISGILCLFFALISFAFIGSEYAIGIFNITLPIYFSIGILLGLLFKKINQILCHSKLGIRLFFFTILCAFVIFIFINKVFFPGEPELRLFHFGPLAIGIFFLFWVISPLLEKFNWLGLTKVGDWSYSLYLTHWLTLNGIAILLRKNSIINIESSIIIFSVLTSLAISFLSWKYIEAPIMKMGKYLIPQLSYKSK
ncbi:MAG: acyltransferase [Undibacterium sp.]|uniref:acyltransferase family protein n=1 Tax=Undibacterium sp. TaxID=1914977 RepID=UPI002725810E|nr:acyltransferase [Undibacterium sp.]MDO8651867.1 acyltransferase [Undibacterium sp.]